MCIGSAQALRTRKRDYATGIRSHLSSHRKRVAALLMHHVQLDAGVGWREHAPIDCGEYLEKEVEEGALKRFEQKHEAHVGCSGDGCSHQYPGSLGVNLLLDRSEKHS